ncbi:MAG: glycosyltransferase, partial [Bacteroidales bacterium]|nr:glycosyltransferase [Bacteroidales bacterium]
QARADRKILSLPDDIMAKIDAFLPEQPGIKPLAPFIFRNKIPADEKPLISVIIINENRADHLKELFSCFEKVTRVTSYRIILSDRASTDNSLEIARSFQDKLPLDIIAHDQKFTNSYLYNLAVDSCKSKYLLFLDNKVTFNTDILSRFLETYIINPLAGIIGPAITFTGLPGDTPETRHYGSIKFTINEISGVPDIPFPTVEPGFLVKSGLEDKVRFYRKEGAVFVPPGLSVTCLVPKIAIHNDLKGDLIVPSVTGHAMFCSRADLIRLGGFDLNYVDGFEDIDLCLRFAFTLHKQTRLAHEVEIRVNTGDPETRFGLDDKITYKYNLGTLLNRQGLMIKQRYIDDLNNNKNIWTDDTVDYFRKSKRLMNKLLQELEEKPADMTDSSQIRKVSTAYLKGARDKKLRIAIKTSAFNDERTLLWGDYHFANSLKKAFVKKGYPARVDLHDNWYDNGYMTDDVVIVLRGTKRYHTRGSQINILWNISHPGQISADEYFDYDYVFSASTAYAKDLKEKYPVPAEDLLQCTDSGLFYPDHENVQDEERTDILFVGNSRGVKRKSIDYALQNGIRVEIYGSKWECFIPAEMIKGTYIKNEELRRYYSNCNLLLNDHWDDMVACGFISNRIFDAIACGAIVLTDRVTGIENIFREGLFYYRNAGEFADQVKWIREHFELARQMSLKNSEMVLKNHTFDNRAERILEVALDIYRQRTEVVTGSLSQGKSFFARMADVVRLKKY